MTDTSRNNTVLIADDSSVTREVVKRVVTQMGYTVREAENGDRAISILSETSPVCVISDVCMPVKDGFAVLEYTLRRERNVPVILISSIPFDREELIDRGVKGFLLKPFLASELQNLVSRVIREDARPERRKDRRLEITLPISINDISGGFYRGLSTNISKGGIKFTLNFDSASLPRYFSMDVHISGTHFFIKKVEKIWESADGSDRVSIGGRFSDMSDEATDWLRKILSTENISCSPGQKGAVVKGTITSNPIQSSACPLFTGV